MLLYHLDILSSPIAIYYKNREKHSSIFSVFLSFIIYIIILFLTIYLFIDFLKRRYPSTFYYKTKVENTGKIYLNDTDFFHYVNIINQEYNDNSDKYIVIGYISNNSDFNEFGSTNIDYWIYEKCDEFDNRNFYGKLNKTQFDRGLCIKKYYNSIEEKIYNKNESKFEYPYDLNGIESKEHLFYVIGVYSCNFEFINFKQNNCSITSENESILSGDTAILYLSSAFPDLENYTYPIKGKINSFSTTMRSIFTSTKNIYFHSLKVFSDDGIFFHHIKNYFSLVLDSQESKMNYDIKTSTLFLIQIGNDFDYYKRFYSKLQDIFAKIGGMVGIIIVIVKEIHEVLYYKYRLLYDFNNLIFNEIDKKKQIDKDRDYIFSSSRMPILLQKSNIFQHKKKFNSQNNNNEYSRRFMNSHQSKLINYNSNYNIININNRKKEKDNNILNNKSEEDIFNFNNMKKSYRTLYYSTYIKNFFSCGDKKKNYAHEIFHCRTNILSESRFLSNFLNIEFMKEEIKDINDNLNKSNYREDKLNYNRSNNVYSNFLKFNISRNQSINSQQIDSNKTLESKVNINNYDYKK